MSLEVNLRFLSACFLIFLLGSTGCTRWSTPVQTWEGDASKEGGIAVLEVPGSLQLMSVDGLDMPRYLMESTDFAFHLLPGERQLVVRYNAVFATAAGGRARQAAVVRSAPIEVAFTARSGAVYYLAPEETPSSRRDAEAFADCPVVMVQDEIAKTIVRAGCLQSD